jgi:hypothetical protein
MKRNGRCFIVSLSDQDVYHTVHQHVSVMAGHSFARIRGEQAVRGSLGCRLVLQRPDLRLGPGTEQACDSL